MTAPLTSESDRDIPPPCALPGTPLAAAAAGIDTCVHCGFCLQACPTYLVLEDENDSPRGRIMLMRSLLEGTLDRDDESVHTHIAQCLGCRACETACPSGVPYGHLLEATRATLAETRPIPPLARFILSVFARRPLLRLSMLGARILRATGLPKVLGRLPGQLGFAFSMLASTAPVMRRGAYAASSDGKRGSCSLLRGCVMEGLYSHTNEATERTLSVNGYTMSESPGQGCCGALHAHAGDLEGARKLARINVEAFERMPTDFIVVNAAGCGSMMKEYGHLLHDDPKWAARAEAVSTRVRDVSELLAAAGPVQGGDLALRVSYDAPCHLLHAQRVVDPPLRMLAAIPKLEMLPLADADQCCGSAGIYNLLEPDTSDRVRHVKLDAIRRSGADYIATGNPGCLMQIGAGLRRNHPDVRAVHPVDLLDASYQAR